MSITGTVASAVWNSPWAMSAIQSYMLTYVAWNYGPSLLLHSGVYLGRRVITG